MFDYKELGALTYGCPLGGKVSLIQTAGRVLRLCENKKKPRIHFPVDMTFPTQFFNEYKRAKEIFLKEFGEEIEIKEIKEYDSN